MLEKFRANVLKPATWPVSLYNYWYLTNYESKHYFSKEKEKAVVANGVGGEEKLPQNLDDVKKLSAKMLILIAFDLV